jgi:hypothetical protein
MNGQAHFEPLDAARARLLDKSIKDGDYAFLDQATRHFMDCIKSYYSRDTAVDVVDALEPILGKAWKGRMIFGILQDPSEAFGANAALSAIPHVNRQKINAIKEVRSATGIGLTEAKNLVEASEAREQPFKLQHRENEDVNDMRRRFLKMVNDMQSFGYKMRFI